MKERLDVLLVARGLADSRSRAQGLIRAGLVRVDGQVFDKPGMRLPVTSTIVVQRPLPYVSRGGQKLAAALDAFALEPAGRVCLDVGASTGGFTDVLLQRGARRVFAVDVGRAQLAWKLRQDPRVVSLERTDIRALAPLDEPPTLAVVDVAFISLRLVLPAVASHLAPGGEAVALVKPQFEAGRTAVGRGGVVRDPAVRRQALGDVLGWAVAHGWQVRSGICSPIQGADGNEEYLVWLVPGEAPAAEAELVELADRLVSPATRL